MRGILRFIRCGLIILALVILVASFRSSEEQTVSGGQEFEGPPPPILSLTDRTDHPALMDGMEDGAFHPDGPLTWGELDAAVEMLVEGMPEPASAMLAGGEVREGTYPGAAEQTEAAGQTETEEEDAEKQDRSERTVTRGELAGALERLGLQMEGEEQALVRAIAAEVAQGAIPEGQESGDGTQTVTRREAAVVLVRLAGREPESERLFAAGLKPLDVSEDDWAWPFMADACLSGRIPRRAPGIFRMYGWLYKADKDGALVKDETDGVWFFGPDGRYTTGNARLDNELAGALEASGANELTGREALEAVYLYVKNNFEYKLTPRDEIPEETGSTGWEYKRAYRFFRYGGGTCYGYAATFGLLARALGENAQIVAAEINQFKGDHAFVVIPEKGADWIYDVELEDARPERHGDLDLFHIENYTVYDYWYAPSW